MYAFDCSPRDRALSKSVRFERNTLLSDIAWLYVFKSQAFISGGIGMNIGYARVSATDQDFDGQIERLKSTGCERIFAEKASGKSTNGRHALDKAVKALKAGDTLVVVRLDRLARSIRDLLRLLNDIKAAGARFRALADPWCDTTTPQGELILTVMGGLAEFESHSAGE